MNRLTLFACVVAFAASCGPKSKPTDPGGGGEGTGAGTETAGPTDWASMDHDQRIEFMKNSVMPTMSALFQEFDGERFKEFGCDTCHGKGAEDGSFEMPNPDILPLPESYFAAPPEDHMPILQFMGEKVKPTMASLLGMEEWTPENPTGFGCWSCHTSGDAAAE